MILRKPWLFLIKHFRIIHLALLGLMVYIILKTNDIYQFFTEYIDEKRYAYTFNLTNEYFSSNYLFVTFLIIVIVSVLIVLFKVKAKPWFLYLMILLNYALLMIMLAIGYNLFESMELVVPDIRYVSFVRDMFFLSLGLQYVTVIFTTTRALGFDIKKFNFAKDISKLKKEAKDNEEFEIDVKWDFTRMRQLFNHYKREFKAIIIEQKYLIALLAVVIIGWVSVNFYIDRSVTNRIYGIGDSFKIDSFQVKANKVDVTNVNMKGAELISDKENLVIVDFTLLNSSDVQQSLDAKKFSLLMNRIEYRPDLDFYDDLNDYGYGFNNQLVRNGAGRKLYLVFKVPKITKTTTAYFRYDKVINTSGESLYYQVKLNVLPIKKIKNQETVDLDEVLSFKGSVMGTTTLRVTSFNIADSISEDYEICVTKDNCIPEKELIMPNKNGDKVLKISAQVKYDQLVNTEVFVNEESLFKELAVIHYINKNQELSIKRADLIEKYNKTKSIYLSIPAEAENSSKLVINFNVRGKNYWYNLKKE